MNPHGLYDGVGRRNPIVDKSGSFWRSVSEEERWVYDYKDLEFYVEGGGDKFALRPHKRRAKLIWRKKYTNDYFDAINQLDNFFTYKDGEKEYTLVKGPNAERVSDEAGRFSFLVQAQYIGPWSEWILTGDNFV